MSDTDDKNELDRVEHLLNQYFDELLDEQGVRELEQLLMDDESHRRLYLEKATITDGLVNWAIEDSSKEDNLEHLRQLVAGERSKRIRFPDVSMDLPTGIWVSLGLLVCIGIAMYCATSFFQSNPTHRVTENPAADRQLENSVLAGNTESRKQGEVNTDGSHSLFLARISMASEDVQWGAERPEEFLMRLKRQDFVTISQGVALVEFDSGAQLTLFGPAKIEVLDVDAARLVSGRVRGSVDGGNFRLATPTADVIDLGTEFGVSIDDSANVHVSLFKGSVDVRPAVFKERDDQLPERSVRLDVEGTGAKIASDGTVQLTKTDDAAKFEWTIEPRNDRNALIGAISLVDIIAGGDGVQRRIAGAINPITGEVDRRPTPRGHNERYRHDSHPGEFKRNFSSKFIDGAFITRRISYSIVNSNGDTFEFNRNEGRTLGPIWSRSNVGHRVQAGSKDDFWGTETLPPIIRALETSNLGLLGIHPNAGITFDLEAVRKHHGKTLAKFSGTLRNLDNSLDVVSVRRNTSTANFRVIVDGKPRFEKLGFGKSDGEIAIDVDLRVSDRFLTLASTDAGDSIYFDRVVVVDPVLLAK